LNHNANLSISPWNLRLEGKPVVSIGGGKSGLEADWKPSRNPNHFNQTESDYEELYAFNYSIDFRSGMSRRYLPAPMNRFFDHAYARQAH
jgi:hypothetical protein